MHFSAKKDKTYLSIMGLLSLFIFVSLILPLITNIDWTVQTAVIRCVIFGGSIAFLSWFILSLSYTFHENHLLVKGAFIQKQIPYDHITNVRHIDGISEMLSGFQLLTAKKGLEISYNSGVVGSVKISPQDEEAFLAELKKREPHVNIVS